MMSFLQNPSKTIFDMAKLDNMNNKGVGSIIFEKQKMDIDAELIVTGTNDTVRKSFERDDLSEMETLTGSL
jgi:anti-anti-sigma regulatory factor